MKRRPLTLEVRAVRRGLDVAPQERDWLRVPWNLQPNALRVIEDLLTTVQPDGRRVTRLWVEEEALRPLWAWLQTRDVGPARLALRSVVTTGRPLTRFWAQRARDALGCPVRAAPIEAPAPGRAVTRRVRGRAEVLAADLDVRDALEREPLVARAPHPCETLGIVPSVDLGDPRWAATVRARGGHVHVRLEVELKFDPRAYPDDAEALGLRVARRLLARSPALRRLEATKRGTLEVALRTAR